MRRIMTKIPVGTLAFVLAVFSPGCADRGDGLPREAVEIEASLDSKPIEKAFVQLLPAQSAGAETHVGGILENGRLSIPRESGPVPGEYRVSITSGAIDTTVDPNALPGEGSKPRKDTIPAKYNLKTELQATIEKGGPNSLKFELQSR